MRKIGSSFSNIHEALWPVKAFSAKDGHSQSKPLLIRDTYALIKVPSVTMSLATWPGAALPLKKPNHFRGRSINMAISQGTCGEVRGGLLFLPLVPWSVSLLCTASSSQSVTAAAPPSLPFLSKCSKRERKDKKGTALFCKVKSAERPTYILVQQETQGLETRDRCF